MSQEILAVVAGENITNSEFEAFVQGLPKEQQTYLSNPQFKEHCLEQLISLYLFAKKGEELKLEQTAEFAKIIANAKRDILAQMAMREVLKDITVSEEEIKTYYEEHKEQYKKGATVSAKHILVNSEEKCEKIKQEIVTGTKSFEEAAQNYSTCPSGQRGGDLGEFGKGQMVKEFEEVAFTAELNEVVGPVKTQFGFHLIKVEKRQEESASSLEEVKENIRKVLLQRKQSEIYKSEVEELKAKYVEQ